MMRRPASFLALALAILAASLSAADFSCPPNNPRTYFAGGKAVVTGDFDGDGKPDALVNDWWFGKLSLLYGRGDGSLEPPVLLSDHVLGSPAVADMDGDGRRDILYVHQTFFNGTYTQEIFILYGRDGRTYEGAAPLRTIQSTSIYNATIEVADVTRDGRPDVVLTDGTVRTLVNQLPERFRSVTSSLAASADVPFAIADADADGYPDLVVGDPGWTDEMQVLRGDGTGAFERPYAVQSGSRSRTIAADLNGDARTDVIAVRRNKRAIEVFAGPLTSGKPPITSIATENVPVNAVAADFDGDGANDVAVIERGAGIKTWGGSVIVYSNDGLGHLTRVFAFEVGPYIHYAWPEGIAAADMNRDGTLDLVISSSNSATAVVLGNGNGTFRLGKHLRVKGDAPLNWIGEPYYGVVDAVDLNGDGVDELIGGLAHVGTFTAPNEVTFTKLGGTEDYISAVGDILPEPGIEIVATRKWAKSGISVFSNRGGTWTEAATYPTRWPVQAAGIFHGSLVYAEYDRLSIVVGGFSVPVHQFSRTSMWSQIVVRDINGDGRDDVLVLRSGQMIYSVGFKTGGEIVLLPGAGGDALGPTQTIIDGGGWNSLEVGDFDGDHDLDVVADGDVSYFGEVTAYYFEQIASGRFKAHAKLTMRFDMDFAAADLNADGIDDLAISSDAGVSVYTGSPGGLQLVGNWMANNVASDGTVPIAAVRMQRGKPPVLLGGAHTLDILEFACPSRRRSAGH